MTRSSWLPCSALLCSLAFQQVLQGSWDLVTRVICKVTIHITPIKVLITLVTRSHDPPSRDVVLGLCMSGFLAFWWGLLWLHTLNDTVVPKPHVESIWALWKGVA